MSQDTLATLAALDPALLTDVVRQDQRSPAFELREWTVAPLSHHKIIDTTGGLFCFSGRGYDEHGERPWSVVLKLVNDPGDDNARNPRNWAYWKREVLAFEIGLLADLPGPLGAPRFYGVREYDGGAWIWMEHITEATDRRWGLAEYALAAQQLGAFNGAYLMGTPIPDAPWLTDAFFRSVYAPDDWWTPHLDPTQPGNTWESPVTQQWYPIDRKERTLRLFGERERFLGVLDRLPQVLCHHDAHRRNLLIRERPDGQREVVALDWAFAGRGVLGADASSLVMASSFYFEREPALVDELAACVMEGYLAGLSETGWEGDEREVWLGYLASVALGFGMSMPGWTGYMLGAEQLAETTQQFGRTAEAIATGWLELWEYSHARANEARSLMRQLGPD